MNMNIYEYVNSQVLDLYNCNPSALVWICQHVRLFAYSSGITKKWHNYKSIVIIDLYSYVIVCHIYNFKETDTKT